MFKSLDATTTAVQKFDAMRADATESTISPLLAQYMERAPEAKVTDRSPGQIRKITLPKGWDQTFTEPHTGIGNRAYNEVRLHSDKSVAMSFFYRGDSLRDENQARSFQEILRGQPHMLTPKEISSIPEVLQDKAKQSDFAILSARTQNISGKNVLIVEGRYKALQQDSYHMYIDSDGSGRHVQEVFYQAPKDKFASHLRAAKESLNSIRWKE
jgi:hypothetical protein